jgi:hypothetical protein
LALLGVAALCVVALWLLRTGVPDSFPPTTPEVAGVRRAPLGAFSLFFPSPDGAGLIKELRLLPLSGDEGTNIRTVLEALMAGPVGEGLSPWPGETAILETFVSESGIAYVNVGGSLRWLLPPGDFMEWSVAASLTRTLCENFTTIGGVRILVDGESEGVLGRVMVLDRTYRPAMFEEDW